MAGTPLTSLRVFQKLCGSKAMSRVVLVSTMWDEIEGDIGKERLKELKGNYWKSMLAKGSKTFEYENTRESALTLLQIIVQDKSKRKSIALQQEIAYLRMELRQTGAGQELCSCLEQLAMEVDRKVRAEREGSLDKEPERGLAELRAQRDATLSMVQALKLSLTQRGVTHFRKILWRGEIYP